MLVNLNTECDKKTGVYKIINPYNNYFYIGSTSTNFRKRFREHRRLLRLNKNPCLILQRAYNKTNVDFVFEILEICEKENCIEREQYYLDTLQPKYNICKFAASSVGRVLTADAIKNHFESMRKFNDDQIISMFDYYNNGMPVKEIATIFKCRPNNISSILNKPKKYKLVKQKYNLVLKNKKTKYNGDFLITTPSGETHIVNNLTKYALENNLEASNLNRCSNKIIKSSKGYKVEKIHNYEQFRQIIQPSS